MNICPVYWRKVGALISRLCNTSSILTDIHGTHGSSAIILIQNSWVGNMLERLHLRSWSSEAWCLDSTDIRKLCSTKYWATLLVVSINLNLWLVSLRGVEALVLIISVRFHWFWLFGSSISLLMNVLFIITIKVLFPVYKALIYNLIRKTNTNTLKAHNISLFFRQIFKL
jgi:hypothetical protein